MIETKQLNERISDGDKERAANSYIMSIVAIMAGMPLPIINLLATIFFLVAHRKGSYCVRWHCYQAFVSQLFLFFVNTTTFWWTVSIVLGSNLVTNAYIAWLIIAFIFNVYEIIGTFYSAIKIRKGEHLSWWFYGDIVDLIVKK